MYCKFSDEHVASIFRVSELHSCERVKWTLLITLHEVVTQSKYACQYSVNESPEAVLRIRIGT
jgi:hypothetical protein